MAEQRFIIMNDTDGITASPDTFTNQEADEFITAFPLRYERQGYYRNNRQEKMDPKDVILTKIPYMGK